MKKNGHAPIAGLVMAGGLASRMGACKVLLPVGGKSALEQIASRMREAGVREIVVVTGGHEERIGEEALRLKCRPVHNPAFRSGMFSSVLTGVRALPEEAEAFFFLPADIPLIKPATYRALTAAFLKRRGTLQAAYPTFMGIREHPPLIGRSLIEPILSWSGEGGLRGFLELYPHTRLDVPTADRGTSLDMDTPDDYEALKGYAARETLPDDEECAELLRIARASKRAAHHACRVAEIAARIASALAAKGLILDEHLLRGACLLHDIAKGRKDHEAKGARWLAKRGYGEVAAIVATHKDLPEGRFLSEAEALYLADKLTDGDRVSTLESRMARMETRFGADTSALSAARHRIARAAEIQKRVEDITGRKLGDILRESRPI